MPQTLMGCRHPGNAQCLSHRRPGLAHDQDPVAVVQHSRASWLKVCL
jgi:hypothetical protein